MFPDSTESVQQRRFQKDNFAFFTGNLSFADNFHFLNFMYSLRHDLQP